MKLIVLLSAIVGASAFAPHGSPFNKGTELYITNGKPTINPKFKFVPVLRKDELPKRGQATSGVAGGLSICIAVDEKGGVFALGDKCPPVNQPLSIGKVGNGCITDPVLGTTFNLKSGQVVDWCPSIIGKVVGALFSPAPVPTYPVKSTGANIEVKVDVNYKLAYEQQYWDGVLDAQGKANGKYY